MRWRKVARKPGKTLYKEQTPDSARMRDNSKATQKETARLSEVIAKGNRY